MSLPRLAGLAMAALAAIAMLVACDAEKPRPAAPTTVIDTWSADEQPAFAQHANRKWRVRTRGETGTEADIVRTNGTVVVRHRVTEPNRKIEDIFLLGDTALVVETTPADVVENGGNFAPKRVVRYRLPSPRPEILTNIPLPSPSSPWAAGPSHLAYLHSDNKNLLCVVVLDATMKSHQAGCAPKNWGIQALHVDEQAVTWQQGSETCAQAWGAPLSGGPPRRYGGSGCSEWEAVDARSTSVWSEIDRSDAEYATLFAGSLGKKPPVSLGRTFTGTLVSCGGWTWWRAAATYSPDLSLQLRRWKPGSVVQTLYTTPKADGMVMSRPECTGDTLTFEVGDLSSNVFQLRAAVSGG